MDVSLSNALSASALRSNKPTEAINARVSEAAAVGNLAEQSAQQLEQAVSSIEGFVQKISRDLDFSLDDSTGRTVVKVTDRVSGDVVRQIPSEEALRLAENLEQVRSLLFKAEA